MEITMTTSMFNENEIKNVKRIGAKVASFGLMIGSVVASSYKTIFSVQSAVLGHVSDVCEFVEIGCEVCSNRLENYSDSL